MPVKRQSSATPNGSDRYTALLKALGQVRVEGRPVIELFTEIPDANMYPDYRDVVDTPISLAEIGKRIRVGAYEDDDSLIADFTMMADNAKAYNGDESPVFDDATDILDFMLLYLGREFSKASRSRLQYQVLTELENYKYKGRRLGDAFVVEPDPKEYPNYRDIVKNPTSFSKVRKQLEKNGPASNWAEFKTLVAQIFNNAMLYNQEDSQIYADARSLLKQLDNKIKKYSQIPKHLESALPQSASGSESEGSDAEDDDEDEDDGDEDEEDEVRVAAPKYEDDDDEDFEADSDDMDEEEIGEGGDNMENADGANGMMPDGSGLPPQFVQPVTVYDEIVYRPPDEGVEDALLRMVTLHSTPIPPHLAMSLPIDDVKRAENDILELRIPPSPSKAFTTYATTLPSYQSTLRLAVMTNRDVNPLQLAVLLNGAKLMPLPSVSPEAQWEYYEISLASGLNQVTVIAIKATYGGFMRQYGPPPLADAEPDEERMVLFLNLAK